MVIEYRWKIGNRSGARLCGLCDVHWALGGIDRVRKERSLRQRAPKSSRTCCHFVPPTQKSCALHIQLEWGSKLSTKVSLTGPSVEPSFPGLLRMGVTPPLALPFNASIQDVDFPVSSLGFLDDAFVVLALILLVETR